MPNSIALVGHNGKIGRHALKALVGMGDQVQLRVLHRASSDRSTIPEGVEKVEIDYDDEASLLNALKGIDVVLCTISARAASSQLPLIRAAAKSKIKNFIPFHFASRHPVDEAEEDQLRSLGGGFVVDKKPIRAELQKLEVPHTIIQIGAIADFCLPSVMTNSAEFCGNAQTIPFPMSTLEFVGYGAAEIASAEPSTIINKHFNIVQLSATGDDFVKAMTTVLGKPTTVTVLTDAEVDQNIAHPNPKIPMHGLSTFFKKLWGKGEWGVDGENWEVKGYGKYTLEDIVRRLHESPPAPGI